MQPAQEAVLGVIFLIIVGFVLVQPRIPIPKALHKYQAVRFLFESKIAHPSVGFTIDLGTAPILGVILLLAAQILDGNDLRFGFLGDARMWVFFVSLRL